MTGENSPPNLAPAIAPKRTVTKRVREYEVVQSDRIRLVDAANEFVSHIISKQVLPSLSSGVAHVDIPLSDNETKTFNSALLFLQRQFDIGFHTTEPHEKRIETEETLEFEPQQKESEHATDV